MKSFVLGCFAAILLLAGIVFGCLELGFAPIAADAPPSAWEARLMTSAVHASVRRRAPVIENPLPNSEGTLIAGGKLYLNDCVGCHGAPGRPPSQFGATFYPPAPQFPIAGSRFSQAQLFWVAKHGIRMSGMYPQSPEYSDAKLWSLAAFIARIKSLPPSVVKAIQQQEGELR